jgi:paraquat-inducible protein A
MVDFKACHACGLIHHLPPLGKKQEAVCSRCGSVIQRPEAAGNSIRRTMAFVVTGLILYFPGILLPILLVERLGHSHASSILVGAIELIEEGSLLVGGVILIFSIIIPLAKFLLLLVLCSGRLLRRKHQAWTYKALENIGRWGMLDVLLVGILVALVKLGDVVQFEIGSGALFFSLSVAMSMLASTSFDPHAIWDDET